MRYLVTGSSGIVGSYLVRELLSRAGYIEQIVALSRNNRYFYDEHPYKDSAVVLDCYGELRHNCIRLISQFKPDIILHCAGEGRQNAPNKDIWNANVTTTFNLLEACRILDKVKFIYCSSIMVDKYPRNLYAASKDAGENLVDTYSNYGGITGLSIRFPAVAGAGNKHGVVKDIVAKLLNKSTNKLSLLTNSKKPFVYAEELARNILEEVNTTTSGVLTLCPKDSISVKDIAEIAMEKTGINKEIVWSDESWFMDQQEVKPTFSHYLMIPSKIAIEMAIDDILKEDYNYAG